MPFAWGAAPDGLSRLLNELAASQANVVFQKLTVSAMPSAEADKAQLRFSTEATAFPALP